MFEHTLSTTAAAQAASTNEPVAARSIGAAVAPTSRATRISSGRLLAGARELVIEHAGQEYHLRLTRNDKLILTK
jgi:hemin uptake protein HemP